MVVHRKNLLEAFRHAGSAPVEEPEPPAGPFAASAPPPEAEQKRALPAPALPVWVPWAFGVVLAFVSGLAVGRSTAPVRAGEKDGAGGAGDLPAEVRYEGSSRYDRPAESAAHPDGAATVPSSLVDPANRYTIIVATYGPSRRDYADATRKYLHDAGFGVMPVAELNGNYIVLVGAAATVEGLRPTVDRLVRLDGWDGAPEAYADAYVEKIDRLIDR